MAYRIEYDACGKTYEIHASQEHTFGKSLIASFALFLILTLLFWPEGAAVLREILIPGDNVQTMEAMESFSRNLRDGVSFREAFSVFCREIIHGV